MNPTSNPRPCSAMKSSTSALPLRPPLTMAVRLAAVITLAALSGFAGNAQAGGVYKYVDDNGTVVYSEFPPGNQQVFEEVKLPYYPPVDPEARRRTLEEMRATSDRLQADRLEREAARAPEDEPKAGPSRPQTEDDRRTYPYWYRQDRYRNPSRDRGASDRGRASSGPPEPTTGEERLRQNLRSPLRP